jgi:purine catabolism regulator
MILLTKMYEIAIASRSGDIVQQLSTLLDTDIIIEDGATGLVVMGADSIADDRTRERRYPLGLPEHGTMRIGESAANPLNSLLLVHLQRILETELSRFQLAVRDYTLTSQKNFRTLLSKRELSADESLTGQLNPAGGFRVIAVEADGLPLLATQSWLKGLRLLLGEHGPYTVMYVGLEDVPVVKNLILQSSIVGGISVPFRSLASLDIGIEESVSALREAVRRQSDWVEYERMNLGVLARSEWEAREIVADALGPLAERGEKSDVLRDTLFVFLECERNWADTATRLGIHRQTLAYRLKRVETATGRDLRTTSALSILWLAYQAWKQYFD